MDLYVRARVEVEESGILILDNGERKRERMKGVNGNEMKGVESGARRPLCQWCNYHVRLSVRRS